MSGPFLLAQLSDPHIGADWGPGDTAARLGAAVETILAMPRHPDAVLVSGDLADHATEAEYEQVRELLEPLRRPVYVLPGNHDNRSALRSHFAVTGAGDEPVQYAVDLGPVRLVALDTTRPGVDPGELDSDRLDWLDAELAATPAKPTLLAMHHPPLLTGVQAWDELVLPDADRRALAAVIERHPQVRRLVSGHLHRAMTGDLAGRTVVVVPSTYVQGRLNFGARELELAEDEPAGLAVHAVDDRSIVSHIQPVR